MVGRIGRSALFGGVWNNYYDSVWAAKCIARCEHLPTVSSDAAMMPTHTDQRSRSVAVWKHGDD